MDVTGVEVIGDHKLRLTFEDGTVGAREPRPPFTRDPAAITLGAQAARRRRRFVVAHRRGN